VLIFNVSSASSALIWEGDFSGYKIPGMQKERRRWWVGGGKRVLARAAAVEMLASSAKGGVLVYALVGSI
jgi:hypothetical protein